MNTVGEWMRSIRLAARMTMDDVAEVSGISQPTLSRWENGGSVPRGDRFRHWATAIGIQENSELWNEGARRLGQSMAHKALRTT